MMQPRRDEDLFAAARAMPSAEREHFLARACRDATTRRRLTTLLDAFDDAVDFDSHRSLEAEHGFEQLRSYRLLQELGEGGCGIAYLAEQLAPVKRQVALKVIKPGMDTKAVVARFEAERQLLALMDHPNVAKVFDAGSTASGRPFFVMELVQGIRITEYCEQMQLSIAERLQLFVQVCHAIQHAHHKGVMHRDIKPSNVLVTMHDGQPMVKVIDFGIAKAIQGPLSGQTLHTALDQFLGTPAYISPEQTELGQRNVDTRSDIYSLGVLLYELLTGCTPLDTEELLQSSADEMRRRVREEEPLIPSARLKEVRGDLDWIVMRCLEKDPARRYQTVSDVIAELQRYLRHEPVEARPPSVAYIVTKFARRNRADVRRTAGRRDLHRCVHRDAVDSDTAHRCRKRSRGAGRQAGRSGGRVHARNLRQGRAFRLRRERAAGDRKRDPGPRRTLAARAPQPATRSPRAPARVHRARLSPPRR